MKIYAAFKFEDPSPYYAIVGAEKLGVGGFGKVYKAKRKSDGKKCALKLCDPREPQDFQLMYNEVGLMKLCKGDNETSPVIEVLDAFEYQNKLFIFVELMSTALTQVIKSMMPEPEYNENVIKYMLKETLKGLHFLHQNNIVHRDIKSDNILANEKGAVKLADFGYAAQLTQEVQGRSSKVGTLCWMAPELVKAERKYDVKADIWSFGIFAFELANGNPPHMFEPQSRFIINLIARDPPKIGKKWSQEFREFVDLCLTKDPKDRPSAHQLLGHPFLQGASKYKSQQQDLVKKYNAKIRQAKKEAAQKRKEQEEAEMAKSAAAASEV